MQAILMWIEQGWIRQASGDGRPFGDTAHRHGFLQTAVSLRYFLGLPREDRMDQWTAQGLLSYDHALSGLNFPVNPVRCPLDTSGPKDFSRDQMIPNVVAMRLIGTEYDEYLSIIQSLIEENNSRLPNGDWATPMFMNLFRHNPSILGLGELFLNSILCSLKVRINSDDTDQTINTFCMFAFMFTINKNSIILKLARCIFKYLHPGVNDALISYFRPDMGGNPELAEVWSPIVKEILK